MAPAPPLENRPPSRREGLGVACALAAYLAVALPGASWPGLYYDEILFVNAALGGPTDQFVHTRLFGVPVLLMTYLGALKSALYFPIFRMFDVNVWSVRAPTVLITTITLLLAWRLLRRLVGPRWALAGLFLMALDPALVYHVRYDWGPVCLMLLFEVAALSGLLTWLATGRRRVAALTLGAVALGIYDKLNFIWITNALVVSVLLLHQQDLKARWKQDRRGFIVAAGAFAVLIGMVVVLRLVPLKFGADGESRPRTGHELALRIRNLGTILRSTLDGDSVYKFLANTDSASSVPMDRAAAGAVGLALLLAPIGRRLNPVLTRFVALCAVAVATIFVQAVMTPAAGGSHHMMTLWVFSALGLIASLALLAQMPSGNRPRLLLNGLFGLGIVALLGSQLRVHAAYASAAGEAFHGRPTWSPSILDMAREVRRLPPGTEVHCVDWGLCNQILDRGFVTGAGLMFDSWPAFKDLPPDQVRAFFESRFRGRRVAFVTFAPGKEQFPSVRPAFDALRALDSGAFTTRSFGDIPGVPVVEMHLYDPGPSARD